MKTKNLIFKKVISAIMASFIFFLSAIGTISVSAFDEKEKNNTITRRDDEKGTSDFVSKDIRSDKINYYSLYNNEEKIDFTEDMEASTINEIQHTYKSSDPYFPNGERLISVSLHTSRSIIGSDERTRVVDTTYFPYSAICQIKCYWPDGSTTFESAWMYWKDIAITAGHSVYDVNRGGWVTMIDVFPGVNESYCPYGSTSAIVMHSSSKWIDESDWEYDYGLIELADNIGEYSGYFGIEWTAFTLWNTEVTIAGYPAEYQTQMWKMSGRITKSRTRKVYYEIDITDGQSGSPIFKSDNRVIAINAYNGNDENSGTRITSAMFDYFSSFRD